MNTDLHKTWETYVASWKSQSLEEKRTLFEQCLECDCQYQDPLILTHGWDELETYMQDFHSQFPGGFFETTYYYTHNNKSIAKWQMKNADNDVMDEGISYGEYNDIGFLTSITGFFEPPPQV